MLKLFRKQQKDIKSSVQKSPVYSIDIYIDKEKNILFIPVMKTNVGFGRGLNYYKQLDYPYSRIDIGEMFLLVYEYAKLQPIINAKAKTRDNTISIYEQITGKKRYSAFSKDRELIVTLFSDFEISFQYWHHHEKGSYGLRKGDVEISVSVPFSLATSQEIGKAVENIYNTAMKCELFPEN